jgi:UrcA family protein
MSLMNRHRGAGGQTLTALSALLCTAAFMATAAVAAGEAEDSIHLTYVTTDLTRPEGAEALYWRIQRAARLVCHAPEGRDLPAWQVYHRCYDRAVDNAVEQVGASALTALHRSKTQRNAAG